MTNKRQILFDYWEKIPSFAYIDVPKDKYYSHPVRSEIIGLLREGIEEKSSEGKSKVRHALNVIEIKELLKLRKDITMSSTNIYFHLDTLLEIGLIKVVTTLQKGPHGRNKVKYFGRVARNLFVGSEKISLMNYTTRFEEFQKLANILDLSLPRDYSNLPQKLLETKQQYYKVLGNWLVDHEDKIAKEKLDIGILYDFLKMINEINPKYNDLFSEVFFLLKNEIPGL
ncbi:MAG: hypothetical protein ACFFAE_21725 [Candidatus Hodarchaeota archaeon]